MLDFTKVTRQMQGISQHLTAENAACGKRMELAQNLLVQVQAQQQEWVQKHQKWRDRFLFNVATPVEPLDNRVDIPVPPRAHTAIATDGSQISPSHHEIAYCYLINIGRVVLHYGQGRHPMLDSLPEVFYKADDLYMSQQWGISLQEWLGHLRTVSEAVALAELCTGWVESQGSGDELASNSKIPSLKSVIPTIAMVDGSLIYWFLEQLPGEARDRILPPILQAWEQIRAVGIPLIGYLSASRSSEALNFFRLPVCPHPTPNCQTHCSNLDKLPCQVFEPLRDTTFWASQLQPGQRGPLWRSSSRVLDLYGGVAIYFCHVNVGTEIARVDMPAWVAEDTDMLNQALGLMLAQVQKGYGYPITLSEAHNHAVVTGSDRAHFFALLEQQMIKAGLKNVGISYKETRKRGSIA